MDTRFRQKRKVARKRRESLEQVKSKDKTMLDPLVQLLLQKKKNVK